MKYIDSEKLIAEIERRKADAKLYDMSGGDAPIYDELLSIIASLQQEQPEVDLENEIEKYFYDNFAFISSAHTPTKDIVSDIANHFYELGLNARK